MVPPEYRYGFHRVLSPPGAVVQAADVVDARPELLHPSECLLRVDRYVRVVSFQYCGCGSAIHRLQCHHLASYDRHAPSTRMNE